MNIDIETFDIEVTSFLWSMVKFRYWVTSISDYDFNLKNLTGETKKQMSG